MNLHDIGTSTGIVWQPLNSKGRLSFEELQSETQLGTVLLAAAIGWLAREDKICFQIKSLPIPVLTRCHARQTLEVAGEV